MVSGSGFAAAAASAGFNGSFGLFQKLPSVKQAQVSPVIFNFWFAAGIVVSSLLLLIKYPLELTAWGILSGALLMISTASTFQAIDRIGLSMSTGLLSGTSVIVSFSFGALVQGEAFSRTWLALFAILILVAAIVAYAAAGQLASMADQESDDVEQPFLDTVRQQIDRGALSGGAGGQQQLGGAAFALLAGTFGGLVLAPMSYAPAPAQGLAFVPSMALGVLITAPIVTAALVMLEQGPWPPLQPQQAALPGIASGACWNLGNTCSIIATTDPQVGLSIAYPVMQCGLFVAGLWGILLYSELKGKWQLGFWVPGLFVLLGASMLAAAM